MGLCSKCKNSITHPHHWIPLKRFDVWDRINRKYIFELKDDVESLDGEEDDYTPRRYTPSPILLPIFPPSQHSGKVFLEKDSGFRTTTQRKLTSKLPGNQIQPDILKPTKTPLDLSLDSQRIFRSGTPLVWMMGSIVQGPCNSGFNSSCEPMDFKKLLKLTNYHSQKKS